MHRIPAGLALLLLPVCCGCGDSGPPGPDGGRDAAGDAFTADGPGSDGSATACGNRLVDPGESCDDGNDVDGDGCTAMCRFEARCGDGDTNTDEVCDDGNRQSGDGCRSDCGSDETCGNGTVDTAAGELCDGTGCSPDCHSVVGCGDGSTDAASGETCDDGATLPWDGCGADCRKEIDFILNTASIDGVGSGCDFGGDGSPDNAFARSLGATRGGINGILMTNLTNGGVILLILRGLDDPLVRGDESFRTSLVEGSDNDTDTNNFTGFAQVLAPAALFTASGTPLRSMLASVSGGVISAGPEDVDLTFPINGAFTWTSRIGAARLTGMVTPEGGEGSRLDGGQLCGGIVLRSLAEVDPNPLLYIPGVESLTGCDDAGSPQRFVESIAGGTFVLGMRTRGAQPDVDLDGDGLELIEIDADSPSNPGCAPVISACVDGDGTRIEGRDCVLDPRIADAMSMSLSFTAVRARVVGTF